MKFGKEFSLQMVSEWQDAYMAYHHLKTLLKDIKSFKAKNKSSVVNSNFSLHRTFSGLTHLHRHGNDHHGHPVHPQGIEDIEEQSILVSKIDGCESYGTTFLMNGEEYGGHELVYFRKLDDEFNKVVCFYKSKVEEVMKEASDLNKQMDALIAFRIKVEHAKSGGSSHLSPTDSLRSAFSSRSREKERVIKDGVEEAGSSRGKRSEESNEDEEEEENKDESKNMTKPSPLEILNKVKLNPTVDSPTSIIKVILNAQNLTELKFSRENLRRVEQILRRALVEFYHKLLLLRSYCFLNTLAFSKIMKKYDKITSRNAGKTYMNMMDNSYLGSSDEVSKLMVRVEDTFIQHFSNSNRRKGMHMMRPKDKKERHIISFFTGFFGGCSTALILALILISHARDILNQNGRLDYMDNMFPLYSLFGFIILHMVMYAANIFFWRRYRVNYSFIFGFKKGTELGYREVLLLTFGFAVLALACVISNLDMEMDTKTNDYIEFTELLPLNLVLLVFIVLFCPFNIIYRSSRYFFLVSLFRSLAAPLYKVTLPDFFMADQMTSQAQAFRSLEFYICYYGWGDYKHRQSTCKSNNIFKAFYIIIAAFPFWIRFLQCVRRLLEEKDSIHAYNGLKYFLTVVAVCLRTIYGINKGLGWKVLAWIFSGISGAFCAYWDLYYDWGVLQRNSKNRWLRDKLLVPHKSVYFVAMVLDVLLRFAWLETVLDFQVSALHSETLIVIYASLEILRRGIWNFFRLENEHLNNVGRYRAFKSVPLPFNYDEDEADEDE